MKEVTEDYQEPLQRTRRSLPSHVFKSIDWTCDVFQYKNLIEIILTFLDIEDVVDLSCVDKGINIMIKSNNISSMIWSTFIERYFNILYIDDEVLTFATFKDIAKIRIWNWNMIFEKRVFWARMGFTLSSFFEDNLIFGCSVFSSSNHCRKIDYDFENWDDGHRIVFNMPEDYYLSLEFNYHSMGTWRVGKGKLYEKKWYEIDRLDGHPIGPGFLYSEVETIISYITKYCILTFDIIYLWPLFFPAIALNHDMKIKLSEFIKHLHESGWKNLRLSKKNWILFEEYFSKRIDNNIERGDLEENKARYWNQEADKCFCEMMNAIDKRL